MRDDKVKQKTIDKAKRFVAYVNDEYNKDRHIMATLGSFGVTFNDDVEELLKGLMHIGECGLAEKIKEEMR